MGRRRTAVLISGSGSNLQALIDATAGSDASAGIALVVANRADAFGLERARRAGIEASVVEHGRYASREAFEAEITRRLEAHNIELVCLAGFMRVLTASFTRHWHDRLLNIHPSLLPAFPGLDTHRRALEAGVRFSGCTVHLVRASVDQGPILVQAAVPVLPGDDEDSLRERVLAAEHRCYPLALELWASGRARVTGERVVIDGHHAPQSVLINPLPA